MTDHTEEPQQRIAALEAENERLHERNDSLARDLALCATEREKFRAELAALKTQEVRQEVDGLTIERDFMGTMHIKVGDFDYVQVRYQYPYTDNARTRRLAEQIAELIRGPQPGPDVRALVEALEKIEMRADAFIDRDMPIHSVEMVSEIAKRALIHHRQAPQGV